MDVVVIAIVLLVSRLPCKGMGRYQQGQGNFKPASILVYMCRLPRPTRFLQSLLPLPNKGGVGGVELGVASWWRTSTNTSV